MNVRPESLLGERHPVAEALRRPQASQSDLPGVTCASELMFFRCAPFAHIVAYEDHVRARRKEREMGLMMRGRRLRRWRGLEPCAPASSCATPLV